MYYGQYFDWLCSLINLRSGSYDILIHELYSIEFTWVIDLDANRAEDGIILRGDFHQRGFDEYIEDRPCSVLEALIAMARNMDYILDDDDRGDRTRIWFWEMIQNLKLDGFTDASFEEPFGEDMARLDNIREICNVWMNREFTYAGWGSPFPLFSAHRDQRKLHIIDQMNDYILERHMNGDELL